jgi:hypothetical protein
MRGLNRSGGFRHGNPNPNKLGTIVNWTPAASHFGNPVAKPFEGVVSDNFNRANELLAANPNWLNPLGLGGQLLNHAATVSGSFLINAWNEQFDAECFVQVTVASLAASGLGNFNVGWIDTGFSAAAPTIATSGSGDTYSVKLVDGSSHDTGVIAQVGDTLRVERRLGGRVVAVINGQTFNYKDTTPLAHQYPLLFITAGAPGGQSVVDFSAGSINSENRVTWLPTATKFGNIIP